MEKYVPPLSVCHSLIEDQHQPVCMRKRERVRETNIENKMKIFVINYDFLTIFIFRHIKRVGLNLEVPGGTRVIDATGKLILPGTLTPLVQ